MPCGRCLGNGIQVFCFTYPRISKAKKELCWRKAGILSVSGVRKATLKVCLGRSKQFLKYTTLYTDQKKNNKKKIQVATALVSRQNEDTCDPCALASMFCQYFFDSWTIASCEIPLKESWKLMSTYNCSNISDMLKLLCYPSPKRLFTYIYISHLQNINVVYNITLKSKHESFLNYRLSKYIKMHLWVFV